jgi:protein-disulfide isomerase
MSEDTQQKGGNSLASSLGVPIAIILAGALIAGSVYLSQTNTQKQGAVAGADQATQAKAEIVIEPVTAADHILGNPNAKLVVIEYSDFECPFCKNFHATMHRIMNEYGTDGTVAWVYRQFPIVQLHSKAPKESEAAECVAELGGNTAFWKFADRIFEITPSNDGLDPSKLPEIAAYAGVNVAAFNDCLSSGKKTKMINEAVSKAAAAGAQGTPYSVIVTKDGQKFQIDGAQPYDTVKAIIESLKKGK